MRDLTIKNFDSFYELKERFIAFDRDKYSNDGYKAMYDFLMEYSPDTTIDIIGLCCEFAEYDSWEGLFEAYGNDSKRYYYDNTTVCELDNGGVLIMDF